MWERWRFNIKPWWVCNVSTEVQDPSWYRIQDPPRILDEHWCIYSCLQIPPKENWFQYVSRVYATAIIFPCISTLGRSICNGKVYMYNVHKLVLAGLVYTPAHGIWIYGKVLAVWIFVHGQYSSLGKQKLRNYNPNYFGELCIIHC